MSKLRGPVLVTGAAGFVGFHFSKRLLEDGWQVVGIDNLNAYYDPKLKNDRIAQIAAQEGFHFEPLDLVDANGLESLFQRYHFPFVVHLAAQAGVRYSLENPRAYVDSNLVGMMQILELCRHHHVKHLLYASSSSVYGANRSQPFDVQQHVDHPISIYAATKKANELMAHSYSHLFRLPTTGLRFFTVYGPWGRPDMALYKFTEAIFQGKPIDVYNHGLMERDFTYVDDVVEAMVRMVDQPALSNPQWDGERPDPATSNAPYRIYNIGNNRPVKLAEFIQQIERATGRKAVQRMLPMQPGDVLSTFANIDDLQRDFGFSPSTTIDQGVERFVEWYRQYHRIDGSIHGG
ncbi:MAG: NAD-dependent epimerase [Pirellulaceae bacterium]|jgi:UDP-glucuronate 4-epimerase